MPNEQDKDLQERVDGFNQEIKPLLGKYELGLAASPFIDVDGTIKASPILLSVRKKSVEEDKLNPPTEEVTTVE